MQNRTLKLDNICKSYQHGKKTVLQNLSLEVTMGASLGLCIGILGANGCGKSTLLSILAGISKPDSGTLLWNKESLMNPDILKRLVGYVPQDNPLIDELSALDNLRLWYSDSPLDLTQELKDGTLATLGIQDFLNMRVRWLSGGMKKRLSIGCSLAKSPDILLLDEPGAALDLVCKEQIRLYLDYLRQSGKLILIATHEESEIALCDYCYILKDGCLYPYSYDGNLRQLANSL